MKCLLNMIRIPETTSSHQQSDGFLLPESMSLLVITIVEEKLNY